MRRNPLLEAIRAAFPPIKIRREAFALRGDLYIESLEYATAIEGRTWEELDANYFARRADVLFFAGAANRATLLPLYLHLLLVFSPQSPIPGPLVAVLTKPEPADKPPHLFEGAQARFAELVGELTGAQKEVVAATLHEYIAMHPNDGREAQRALDRFWGTFAEGRHSPLRDQLRTAFPLRHLAIEGVFDESRYSFGSPIPGFKDYREVVREAADEYLRGIDGKTWEELDRPFLAKSVFELAYFSQRHFVEALPAFLNALIVLDPTSYIPEYLIRVLTPPDPQSLLYERELARFDRVPTLDGAQRAAVAATLRLFVTMFPHQSVAATTALERYWQAY